MQYQIADRVTYKVFSPKRGIDWSFDFRKVDDFVAPFLIIGILIIVLLK